MRETPCQSSFRLMPRLNVLQEKLCLRVLPKNKFFVLKRPPFAKRKRISIFVEIKTLIMKKILSTLLFFCCSFYSYTQSNDSGIVVKKNGDTVFTAILVQAKFPGGAAGWQAYLEDNLKVKTPIKHHAPPGNYTVLLSFLVLKDGTVTEVESLQDPGYGCAEEAVRVLKKSPKWLPAVQNGKTVTYRQKQSITFVVD